MNTEDQLMNDEIKVAIAKNLPNHLSDVLKSKLQELDSLKLDEAKNKKYLFDLRNKYTELEQKYNELLARSKTYQEIEARDKAVKEAEKNQRVYELEQQLSAEKRVSNSIYNLCDIVFRNRQFVHGQYMSENFNKNSDYNAGYNKNITINTTSEEK